MKSLMIAAASVATLATVGFAGAASAQDTATDTTVYGTIGYANVGADDGADVDLGAIQGRIGARFGKYFGVEGELAGGVKGDDVSGVDVDLKHELGVFAVGYYPVTERFDVFGRVGYATSEIEASGGGISASTDIDGIAYGVGGQYFFTDKDGVRLDFTRHDSDDGEADVVGVSYVRKF